MKTTTQTITNNLEAQVHAIEASQILKGKFEACIKSVVIEEAQKTAQAYPELVERSSDLETEAAVLISSKHDIEIKSSDYYKSIFNKAMDDFFWRASA